MRRVCGLDVHKDSIYMCILGMKTVQKSNQFLVY